MGQYYYIPDPGEQIGNYTPPVMDRLAQLRKNQQVNGQTVQTSTSAAAPPTPPQNSGVIWVSGKEEADKWPIAFGCAVALWDANNPVIYLRQADSTGKPSTKVYDLVERTDAPPQQKIAPQIDMSRYVTIDQLEEILSERLKKPVRQTKPKEDT